MRERRLTSSDVAALLEERQGELEQIVDTISNGLTICGAQTFTLGPQGDLNYTKVVRQSDYSEADRKSLSKQMEQLGILELSITDGGLVMLELSQYTGKETADQGLIYSEKEFNSSVSGLSTNQLSETWYWYSWASL